MYVAVIPNRNSPPAILLRESYREHRQVNNRTLANRSAWPRGRIEALRRLLQGERDHLGEVTPTRGPGLGLLFVLKPVAETLGLTAALGKTRLAKRALFLVRARVAPQGARRSAVRWAQDHAVAEGLALGSCDEDDLDAALDHLCAHQEPVEQALYPQYRKRRSQPPTWFLYDLTSSYLEGPHNAWGEYGDPRDGKRGKLPIVIGLLSDREGEPLAVPIRALTDPQIRRLLGEGTWQMGLFSEDVCEVEAEAVRYLLRKNQAEAARERHRLEDRLAPLARKGEQRNQRVEKSPRCQPEAGLRNLQRWGARHKLPGRVAVRPVWVRKESRTRGHVFCCLLALKLRRELERRLQAKYGTPDTHAHTPTRPDALAALSRLCRLEYPIDEKTTLTRLPQPDARQQEILEALGVSLPKQ